MNNEEQIAKLNSETKCKLGISKIHGIGVIALRTILKGEKLYCTPNLQPRWFTVPYNKFSKLFPEVRELILARWPSIVIGSHFLSPNDMSWLITYMNHQPTGKCNYDQFTDTAIKDIQAGEEVTEDYSLMKDAEKLYPFLKENMV